MIAGYFGFYEDITKTVEIITSAHFVSKGKQKNVLKGNDYRLSDGTLEDWQEWEKIEEMITLKYVSQADLDTLKTLYKAHEEFYYCPDIINRAGEVIKVKWTGIWGVPIYNKITRRYSMSINLKEV